MDEFVEKVKTLGVIVKSTEQLPYGNKSRGKLVPPENGRRAIFVPSWGSMEKEEIDYVVEVAQEQEDERIKRGRVSLQKVALEMVTGEVRKAPPGQRAKVGKKIIEEMGGKK